jgi:hypothetical protein
LGTPALDKGLVRRRPSAPTLLTGDDEASEAPSWVLES